MAIIFKPKPPPVESPEKTQLKWPGEIRKCILEGRKLFAIKQLPNGYEFDYRIWISEYDQIHLNALIHGQFIQLGHLIHDNDGNIDFARSTLYESDYTADTLSLAAFAGNQFDALWTSVDKACRQPIQLAFFVYE